MEKSQLSKLALFLSLAVVALGAVSAQATTYDLTNEYWLKAGAIFPGTTLTAGTQGVYEETTTGASPVITKLTTTSYGNGFHFSTPVPGEFTPNDGGSALVLNGWGASQYINGTPTSMQINTGTVNENVTGVHNVVNNPTFQYFTGATVNAATGVISGTSTAFNLNSLALEASPSVATGFTLEGLLGGNVVDQLGLSVNGNNPWVTVSPGWTNIDEVELLGVQSSFPMEMANINITPYVAPVPEPTSLTMFGSGLLALAGMAKRKLCR